MDPDRHGGIALRLDDADDRGVGAAGLAQRREAIRRAVARQAREQAARGLRIEQDRVERRRPLPPDRARLARVLLVERALDPGGETVARALQDRQIGGGQDDADRRGADHLDQMAGRPNPVTSVQARAPCSDRISAAARFDASIEAIARSIHLPFALHRMSAANSVPVPSALVRDQPVAGAHPRLAQHAGQIDRPADREPQRALGPLPRMAPHQRRPGIGEHLVHACIMSAISVAILSSGP